MQSAKALLVVLFVFLATPVLVQAQTATTGAVSGTVTDPTAAVVPGAEVVLLETATSVSRSQPTNAAGQYIFVNVTPGTYKVTVTRTGFRQATVASLKVQVAKAYTLDFTLEVGTMAEVVEVTAGMRAELQTQDAAIGNVIPGDFMKNMPNVSRRANSLYMMQPAVTPQGYGFNASGGAAGAKGDQQAWYADGIEVTAGVAPDEGNNTTVPLPAESVEEFRMSITNANATFGRAAGGQISVVRKRGSNAYHGTIYWYHQNDNLNATSWTNNRTVGLNIADLKLRKKLQKPEEKDNRFGASLGGPILKEKTFFFFNYEGRRFPDKTNIVRLVPTDTGQGAPGPGLRQGVLRFRDASGAVVSYPLATSTLCGSAATTRCDPRQLGLNPVVSAIWRLLPIGNDFASGDGLNTIGFRSPASREENSEYAWLRLDHNFTQKWRYEGSFGWSRTIQESATQVDIGGLLPGHTLGIAAPARRLPSYPRNAVAALTGEITPRLTNDFRFGYVNGFNWTASTSPFPQVPTTNVALDMSAGLLDEPVDVASGVARSQGNHQHRYQFSDNLTWVKGRHTLQFGGTWQHWKHFHMREDKVVGAITSLIAEVTAGTFFTVPTSNRARTCGSGGAAPQTNCLLPVDVTRWNQLYAGALGILDNISVLMTRDAKFNPQPFGIPLQNWFTYEGLEFYAGDTWRLRPSLTLSLGLSYSVQMPTKTLDGKVAMPTDVATGKIIRPNEYIEAKRQAALQGQIFNPTIGFVPMRQLGRSRTVDTEWNNFSPRLAAAWNPSFQNGLLGRLFGERKTVLRGGYSIVYDRQNLVSLVLKPVQAAGFGQQINLTAPVNANGEPRRIGVDGPAPLPAIPPPTIPFVVSVPFGELRSTQLDVGQGIGYAHTFDFTIQRELPGDMLLEVGYIGRASRNLFQQFNLNAVPFFMKDAVSGQTFAQAYDALAAQLRGGVGGSAVAVQQWFENFLPPAATLQSLSRCTAFTPANATSWLACRFSGQITTGNVSDLWHSGIDDIRRRAGRPPINNMQIQVMRFGTDGGVSNYHGVILTLQKRPSHGLRFAFNYTYSKWLDQVGSGSVFNAASNIPSPFDPDLDYTLSNYDHPHLANFNWYYELPSGRGRRWSTGNWADKLWGGWYLSGIFNAFSGSPLTLIQSGQAFGGGSSLAFSTGAIPIAKPNYGSSVHPLVAGSGGIGTTGNPATGGSGLNLFKDPEAVFKNFRFVRLSEDGRSGRNILRGLPHWNLDMSLGKRTNVTEKVAVAVTFDFFNLLNNPQFDDPSTSFLNRAAFGVITSQFNTPRRIQFGLRVEF